MSKIDLHIISFDIPYPANYGGVIDVFYKLKTLHELGYKISLHCFEYGRARAEELKMYCSQINYYDRSMGLTNQLSAMPFIVKSRKNPKLIDNLLKDTAPILFEGLHTCAYLQDERINSRKKIVRMHNVEHKYYSGLKLAELNPLKRVYFQLESNKLKNYESILNSANSVLCISQSDLNYYSKIVPYAALLKPFVENQGEIPSVKLQDYCLYHGNLEVAENQNSLRFLMDVFKGSTIKLIVAGKNPSKVIKKEIQISSNIELIENPNNEKLIELIAQAKVSCLPTFQSTGIKLKLINSLINGNVVVVNNQMVEGTELGKYCLKANTKSEWRKTLVDVFSKNIDLLSIQERRVEVSKMFDNKENIKPLLVLLA